jgi:predicted glycosyltransferase
VRYLFYLGHPAHFHLFRNAIVKLREDGHAVRILIKTKDVLEPLLKTERWDYENVLPRGRKDSKAGIAWGLAVRDWKTLREALDFRPGLMMGTSAEIAHAGALLGIPSAVLNEDDADAVPLFAKTAYPFATRIVAPACCRVGRWRTKRIAYNGYHELAYLHPRRFAPDPEVARQLSPDGRPFFILRFARLTAHHDAGKNGIGTELARKLIEELSPRGTVYISSERELEAEFEDYRFPLGPGAMHQALAFASLIISDSQTMTAEAAVLGTPALRFNDFVGRLGYLAELESVYGLAAGFTTDDPEGLVKTVRDWLSTPRLVREWRSRRERMLAEKIDVTAFLVWFAEGYPDTAVDLANHPDLADRFK